jgi:hypothetical protein
MTIVMAATIIVEAETGITIMGVDTVMAAKVGSLPFLAESASRKNADRRG